MSNFVTKQNVFVKCSKEYNNSKICGKYNLLSKKGKFGEDTYINENCEMFIYKVRPEFYVIGSRLGSLSFRAFCKSGDLFSKNNWNIHTKNRKWKPEKEMYVEIYEKDLDSCKTEETEKSIDAFIVYSKYYNIRGGYKKISEKSYGFPVYYNKEDQKYLYRNKYCWGIGPTLSSNYMYMKSIDCDCKSPELANWSKSGIIVKPYIPSDLDFNDSDDSTIELFCDETFPANQESLGNTNEKNVSWIRATKLQPQNTEMVLFHDVEPNDILQGGLGDCWLLSAIAALAEFPYYFKEKIFKTDKVSKNGKYDLQLFDISKNKWITVTIDDRIPCCEKKWYDIPRPLYAQPHENEMYIILIEKALAKICGSYSKLCGGYPILAWMVLTGCKDLQIWGKNKKNKNWIKRIAAIDKIRENPWNFQKMWIHSNNDKNNSEQMFKFIDKCDKNCFVMAASIHGNVMEKARKDGLIERHAYSLLRVYEDEKLKLIQLRNPWGNSHESNLDWCDSSNKWKEYPEVAKKVNWTNDPDGLFWISWNDFVSIFDEIQIAAIRMDKQNGPACAGDGPIQKNGGPKV
tara:strand:+ start:10716 stop:12431 length:1716 start_codon:yes stop_codon:yes gene_type:complete